MAKPSIGLWSKKETEGSGKVIVYSTGTCPYCEAAKEYLKKKGVGFEDKRIDLDNGALQEMLDKSGQMGVPVLEIGGKIIVGFNRASIDAALQFQ